MTSLDRKDPFQQCNQVPDSLKTNQSTNYLLQFPPPKLYHCVLWSNTCPPNHFDNWKIFQSEMIATKEEHYGWFPWGFAKSRSATQRPMAHGLRQTGGPVLIFRRSIFCPVFKSMYAHAQICIRFGRSKWTFKFEFVDHFNYHFNPFRSVLSLHAAKWKNVILCLLVCLQTLYNMKKGTPFLTAQVS